VIHRVETQKIMDECGRYAVIVIGVINNPADAKGALLLIKSDISRLREQLEVAEAAYRRVWSASQATKPPVVGSPITDQEEGNGRGNIALDQESPGEIP
jgi:hypothetical protein